MSDHFLIEQLIFLLAHYFLAVILFWSFHNTLIYSMLKIDKAIKSPKNRSVLSEESSRIKKRKVKSLIWPILILIDLKNDFKNRK